MTAEKVRNHKYVTVYAGEQWCDTHDSAFPCPVDESNVRERTQ